MALAADQTPDQWWRSLFEDPNVDEDAAQAALNGLVQAGCNRGRLLEDLMELAGVSRIYSRFKRSELPQMIKTLRKLGRATVRLEGSYLVPELPDNYLFMAGDFVRQAAMLQKVYDKTANAPRASQRVLSRLNTCVNKLRRRSRIMGKQQAQAALALLIETVTRTPRSAAAQRVAVWRDNSRRNIPKAPGKRTPPKSTDKGWQKTRKRKDPAISRKLAQTMDGGLRIKKGVK
jgi:hypothetical protein